MHTFSKKVGGCTNRSVSSSPSRYQAPQEQRFKAVPVKTPGGLTISAQDWGNPDGPEILFIHHFSQSHLSWIKQMRSE